MGIIKEGVSNCSAIFAITIVRNTSTYNLLSTIYYGEDPRRLQGAGEGKEPGGSSCRDHLSYLFFSSNLHILGMERISSTLCQKVMTSNIYMKRLLYLQKNRKITHCSKMLKEISLFSDKIELPLLYRAILLSRVMLERCHAHYYHLIWSRESQRSVLAKMAEEGPVEEDCFCPNPRFCSRTRAAKNSIARPMSLL